MPLLGGTIVLVGSLVWVSRYSQLKSSLKRAQTALVEASARGHEAAQIIAQQQVEDRELRLRRLCPWRAPASR